ncbi:MAG: phosphoribosyltransferase family protein [Actinomycetota bacterium]|nr:phosphoribosyltransferase family protein [Actinomycetota bacterium]
MRFRDRHEAGERLADALEEHAALATVDRPLILGVPRGGVPVAAVVSERLEAELDVLVAHKLGAPGNPEFAIGAVAEDGTANLDAEVIDRYGIDSDYIDRETHRQQQEVERRALSLRQGRSPIPVAGRICIVVDDGVATGATLEVSIRLVVGAGADSVIAAVPVGPPATIRRLERIADAVVCPVQPATFYAVGAWYEDFSQVSDETVTALLGGRSP